MIRVLIYDDNIDRLEALETLLTGSAEMTCVGAFPDCRSLEQQVTELTPDIVLMDVRMPFMDGIEATRIISGLSSKVKVIIQTVSESEETLFESLRAGAVGYILKSKPPQKILQSILDVHHGGAVISPSMALKVTGFFNAARETASGQPELSPREREVLRLLTDGMSYKMVAQRLGISYSTVNSHVKHIYEKMSVNSLGEAISKALKNNLV